MLFMKKSSDKNDNEIVEAYEREDETEEVEVQESVGDDTVEEDYDDKKDDEEDLDSEENFEEQYEENVGAQKKNKAFLRKKNKNVEEVEEEVKVEDCTLYLVTDRMVPKLMDYFVERGVNLSFASDSLEKCRNEVMMDFDRKRIVVVETGKGLCSSVNQRGMFLDILEMADETTGMTVFYTNNDIKGLALSNFKRKKLKCSKYIEWVPYVNTLHVVAKLLYGYKSEKYIASISTERTTEVDAMTVNDYRKIPRENVHLRESVIQPMEIGKDIQIHPEKCLEKFDPYI